MTCIVLSPRGDDCILVHGNDMARDDDNDCDCDNVLSLYVFAVSHIVPS